VPDASTPLRRQALEDHRRLERDLPGVRVRWSGSLSWGEGAAAEGDDRGPVERLLDAADVARLEPHLRDPPRLALHRVSGGALDPVAVTEALVPGGRGHGADVRPGVAVTALRTHGDRVVGVETTAGPVPSRTVVVAAGVGTPVLCAPLGFTLPVAPSPALLLRFTAPPGLVRTLVSSPEVEVREASEGRLLVAADHDGELGQDDLLRRARRTRASLVAAFGCDRVQLVGVRPGVRPMPADGLPIIGPLPGVGGVHVAVMHSAVTLAPVVGRLVGAEVVDGLDADELRGLRPERLGAPPGR